VEDFYHGLDSRKILASKCPECGKISFPPDGRCKSCLAITEELIELPQTGILCNFIENEESSGKKRKKKRVIYGLIKIDNSNVTIYLPILNTNIKNLKNGISVKAVWANRDRGEDNESQYIAGFEPF
jgi:hypothetical protein